MARVSLSSQQLHDKYADLLLEAPFSQATSPYLLHKALTERRPPIAVSHAAVKHWWKTYKVSGGAEPLKSAQELEEKYGDSIRHLAVEYPSAYKLSRALEQRDPPIFVSDGIAKPWFQKFAGHDKRQYVDSAGHLEIRYGERIRAECLSEQVSGARHGSAGTGLAPVGCILHKLWKRRLAIGSDSFSIARISLPMSPRSACRRYCRRANRLTKCPVRS